MGCSVGISSLILTIPTILALFVAQIIPTVQTAAGGACVVPDQTTEFLAVWLMEESSSSTRANASTSGAGCGSDCNLLNSGSVAQSSTHIEGSYSAYFLEADSDMLYCANATCDEITGATGNFSMGAWVRFDKDNQNMNVWTDLDASQGIQLRFVNTGDKIRCTFGSGDANSATGTTNLGTDTWYHFACSHDALVEMDIWVDGSEEATNSGPGIAASTLDFKVSPDDGSGMDGYIDEAWLYEGVLSDAAKCHICSCGISNWRGCTCSGSSYTDSGVNTTLCNSCTLPSDPTNPIP